MTKNPLALGGILFIITMLIFFVVYYFFSGIDFFTVTMKVNSFILPILYCAVAFISVYRFWKFNGSITFKEAFRRAFIPMFFGGILSLTSIFSFLNFVDTDAKDLLNYQYVQRQKSELDLEYKKAKKILKHKEDVEELEQKYQERLTSFTPEEMKKKDMLTFKHFSVYFGAIFFFYVVISLFFGAFFKTRNAR